MHADPNWGEMADAILRVWRGMGWQAMLGAAVAFLAWRVIEAWGRRPPPPKS